MREKEKTKPADLPNLPCPFFFFINSIWCGSASGPLFLFLFVFSMWHDTLAPLPNVFVSESTEEEVSVLLCDLCLYVFAWL